MNRIARLQGKNATMLTASPSGGNGKAFSPHAAMESMKCRDGPAAGSLAYLVRMEN